jgi:GNAT superfamily N-acetyltransferase/predicted nucleic acid-binding protein
VHTKLGVDDCETTGPSFDAVLKLLKSAKATVGFLPDAALRERAARGTLLIARLDHDIVGYLLYDLPRSEVRIRQLVVHSQHRGSGVARRLVDALAERHSSRRGIALECRRDFDASKVWPRLGFTPITERDGRNYEKKPLTYWWRDFGHPDLFTLAAELDSRPVAALDTNLIIDLADGATTTAQPLLDDWVVTTARLAVTDETYVELDRNAERSKRSSHKAFADRFDRLRSDQSAWKGVHDDVIAQLPGRHASYAGDLHQAARATSAGARWLVTRDVRFQRACGAVLKATCDLAVVTPTELLLELDRLSRGELYRPADLEGTDVDVRELRADELSDVCRAFTNQRAGESLRDFRDRLHSLLSNPNVWRAIVFEGAGDLLALLVLSRTSDLEVPVVRVWNGAAQPTIARQVLGWLRSQGTGVSSSAVRITDKTPSEWVSAGCADEGFLTTGAGSTAFAIRGTGTVDDLSREVARSADTLPIDAVPNGVVAAVDATPPTADGAASLEATFFPYIVTASALKTFLIPIQPHWAGELFDASITRGQLFPRERSLALRREHVYYRSPKSTGGLEAPARVLWYVSGAGSASRTIRGMSLVDDIVVGHPDHVFNRFAHLGVYTLDEVRACSSQERVMALRFSHTRVFDDPIPLAKYRDLVNEAEPGRGIALAGPQPVDEQVFASLARLI